MAKKLMTYDIKDDFLSFKDLLPERKRDLHTKFRVMRRGLKRFDAIMTLAVAQKVKPEAISQLLREEYNNFV